MNKSLIGLDVMVMGEGPFIIIEEDILTEPSTYWFIAEDGKKYSADIAIIEIIKK